MCRYMENVKIIFNLFCFIDRMSDQHRLRGGVRFIEEIPKNNSGSGKSFRRILKEMVVTNK